MQDSIYLLQKYIMYPDSGYKQAHVQSVCARPFSHIHREPGPSSTVTSLSQSQSSYKNLYVQCVRTCLAAIIFIWTETVTKFHVTIVIEVRGPISWVQILVMVPWSTVAQIDWNARFCAFDKQNTTGVRRSVHKIFTDADADADVYSLKCFLLIVLP